MQKIISTDYDKERIPWYGNKFLNGNGFFGIRGTMEEYTKENMPAVNLAGVYDRVGDAWRESVNAPNVLFTYVIVDGTKYALPAVQPKEHTHTLDCKAGIQSRKTVWRTENGEITVESERFAHMSRKNLIAMQYSVTASYPCKIEIVSGIDGDVWDINGPHFKKLEISCDNGIKTVIGTTEENEIKVTSLESITYDFKASHSCDITDLAAFAHITFDAETDKKYTIEKIAAVYTSNNNSDNFDKSDFDKIVDSNRYSSLKEEHVKAWADIWDIAYITIDGDKEAEEALNYSLYHLNCIAPDGMESMSIPARGLSGQVYKGAVFWDTEMFMLDYYLYTRPEIAKTLLMYRVNTLDGALKKAASYGFDGAFYAWESQEGGYDACSDYNVVDVFTKRPMRTFFRDKQVHVSSAVVYALDKYVRVTGDTSILTQGGGTVLYECAKFYRSLLLKYANKDYYEIHDVIGPDEYHERVNNNAYTNAMAKFVFNTAVKYADFIDSDVSEFTKLADSIRKPNINKNGVIEQFDGYFDLEDCSIYDVRERLLDPKEYWGGAYGVASHTQVIKQADVVAMLSMLPDGYDAGTMKANLEYYEPRTEHGSSLSACMYSMLSCRVGNPEFAYPFFMKSATADLLPAGKEWAGLIYIGGTHPASEGGAWMVAVEGFAGMTVKDGKPVFNPVLPEKWTGMHFKLKVADAMYKVDISKDDVHTVKI